jgi:hypothetical protein
MPSPTRGIDNLPSAKAQWPNAGRRGGAIIEACLDGAGLDDYMTLIPAEALIEEA